jgi:DNA-binding transcriptional regulator YhcF (GntR family)
MRISLNKNSDVPVRQQLAEQIVFLITTGQLLAGQPLPSVRAFARQLKVHHNTVSEAYQELVRRKWLSRRPGSRLIVGARAITSQRPAANLDELINKSIQQAKEMGYSLQALTQKVRERLLAQPPDHVLIVEQEAGLREIIRQEVQEKLKLTVEDCSPEEFAEEPGLAVGAQVFAPSHIIEELKPLVPQNRPPTAIVYSKADSHVHMVRSLREPSVVAVVSVSESLLKTARGLFAPAIGRRHTLRELLLKRADLRGADLRGVDVAFCDSRTVRAVKCRQKVHYELISAECLENLRQQFT